jgi:hypothetical protein
MRIRGCDGAERKPGPVAVSLSHTSGGGGTCQPRAGQGFVVRGPHVVECGELLPDEEGG